MRELREVGEYKDRRSRESERKGEERVTGEGEGKGRSDVSVGLEYREVRKSEGRVLGALKTRPHKDVPSVRAATLHPAAHH
ncbi:hypothetical protein E2C01_034931 [Portunus trituberculatus]|uniref:Uncharacterized protein n=1 Tax=Portunus trituberculatus TaxID=210409 RepID=A0A5B7FA42_PORTR|nr:hypothetical protein [Portunus trituberculatus]